MHNSMNGPEALPQTSSVVSSEILAREPLANTAQVKHILIGWKDLDQTHDPRAAARTKQDAETEVRSLLEKIKTGTGFEALMKQDSEDPGSAESGRSYAVSPDAQLVIEFKQLGLRLKINEVGVVQSDFGFHIIKRVE
ncbi:MAG: PpiC-type peptidyl-prolyl cis-trans isomerase [Myxococcales bacterium]|nr:PpiC-type peptidyl-prolyl cis-trans isomerase [Myxococcales bacterium]